MSQPAGTQPCSRIHSRTQALDPISNDRVSHFLGDRDAEPTDELGITAFSRERQHVAPMQLLAVRLDGDVLGASTEPHLLRDAARHRLLLGDRHRDALAALRATATKDLTATTGLLARTESVGAFAALVVRLVRTLAHGMTPAFCGAGSILSCDGGVKAQIAETIPALAASAPASTDDFRG